MSHTLTRQTAGPRRASRAPGLSRVEGVILLAVAAGLVAAAAMSGNAHSSVSTIRVKVEPGTSLWELAAQHRVDGLTIEQNVDLIASINGLGRGTLQAGKTISVPAPESDAASVAMR